MGNYFGIVNTILSGAIDYILGNKAAIITYPVTFLIYTLLLRNGKLRKKGRPNQMSQKQAKIGSYHHFNHRLPLCLCDQLYRLWRKDESPCLCNNHCLCTVPHCQCLFNALKLTTQWGFWLIYNFVQLTKLVFKEILPISENTSFISSMQSELICLE